MFKFRAVIVSVVLVAASLASISSPARAVSCAQGITGLKVLTWWDGMLLQWDRPCAGLYPDNWLWNTQVRELPGHTAPSSLDEGIAVPTNGNPYASDISYLADGQDHTFSVFNVSIGDGPSGPATITLTGTTLTQEVSPARPVAGEPLTISGRLTDSSGSPVAGQTINIYNRFYYDDDGRALLGATTTADDGTYTFTDHPTHNMLYMAVFAGSDTMMTAPYLKETVVSVAPETRLVAHRHSGHRRTTFTLKAGVTPVRGASKTRTVTLQTLRKGKWRNVTGHRLSRAGRANFKIRPGAHGRHRYRVYKKPTSSQGKGVSRTVTLTVG